MPAIRVSIRPVISYEPVLRALGRFILVVSVLFIVFAALFPFDFDFPHTGMWYEIRTKFDSSPEPATLADRVQNFLFFTPLGFGLAAAIRPRRGRPLVALRLISALLLGAALSMTVEVLQVFLGFRDPTWLDVVMNTLGSVAGAGIIAFTGDQLLKPIAQQLAKLQPFATFRNVTIVLVLYTLVQFVLPWRAVNRGSLENWDVNFPLVVGNEAGGGRGWLGTVRQLDLASRAATTDEVKAIHAAGSARQILGDALVASYETLGDGPYNDATGLLKPLSWSSRRPRDELLDPTIRPSRDPAQAQPPAPTAAPPTSQPAQVNHERWLHTSAAIAPAIHRIRQSSQFTLVATLVPDETHQQGPARIVSISGGVYRRNFSIMHENFDLSLRLRTPLIGDDGSAPEALVDDVFDSTELKQIIVTYADPLMVCYVDGVERGRMEITPEAQFIWRLYPRTGWKVRLGAYGFRSYAVVYRLLVLIPLAALLAAATALSGKPMRQQVMLMAGAIVVVALILELILGQLTASGFQIRNLLISLGIASVSVAVLRMRPQRPRSISR